MDKSPEHLRDSVLNVKFVDEEGVDIGGLSRETFTILGEKIRDPHYCLFELNDDARTYSINKNSSVNPEHLLYFRFIGRLLAKGILDQFYMNIHFARPIYKLLLGKKLTFKDLKISEPFIYKSFCYIMNNPIEKIGDLLFMTEYESFDTQHIVELVKDGRNMTVTDENKYEYIIKMAEHTMTKGCHIQIMAIKQGMEDLIKHEDLQIFEETELELLINGCPEINVDDWKNNTMLVGYKSTSKEIRWFWRAVRSFNTEDRAKLLQFVTGSSKLPIEGFKGLDKRSGRQMFSIHVGGTQRLPSAHTCFNQLNLPSYESYEDLRKALLYAISECSVGFGFA